MSKELPIFKGTFGYVRSLEELTASTDTDRPEKSSELFGVCRLSKEMDVSLDTSGLL
jgi:hypothetical protein